MAFFLFKCLESRKGQLLWAGNMETNTGSAVFSFLTLPWGKHLIFLLLKQPSSFLLLNLRHSNQAVPLKKCHFSPEAVLSVGLASG